MLAPVPANCSASISAWVEVSSPSSSEAERLEMLFTVAKLSEVTKSRLLKVSVPALKVEDSIPSK